MTTAIEVAPYGSAAPLKSLGDAPAAPCEKPSIPVKGGIEAGNRVKIRSGKVNGTDLTGLVATAVRDEQFRPNGASGRDEEMVTVMVPLATGEFSYPIDMPRRRLKGPDDGLLRSVGRLGRKCVGFFRDGKYHRTGAVIRPVCAEDAQ